MSFGTGAGKGSLPRKVDLNTYYKNYDQIFAKKIPVDVPSIVSDDDFNEPLDPKKACYLADEQCESCQ